MRENLQDFLPALFVFLLLAVTSRTIVKERAHRAHAEGLLAELERAHAQLQRYAEQALATRQARSLLARDIHDGLGHYLTVINVQLEKAMAFRTINQETADQAVSDALRLTGEALEDIRSTAQPLEVAREPGEDFSLFAALGQLSTNFGRGLAIELHMSGDEQLCSQQVRMVLFRVAQEALTNVQKHARARRVVVELTLAEQTSRLVVSDDGCGFNPEKQPAGGARYGITGMRERLEIIGGTISLTSQPGAGTRVEVAVPNSAELHRTAHRLAGREGPAHAR